MGRARQGSSLTWLSIRIGLQGRKSGESNKLFDLFLPRTGHESVLSVKSVVEKEPHALRCLEGTTMSNRGQRPRIYDSENLCLEGSTPEDRKVFSDYRLGEDGDLL